MIVFFLTKIVSCCNNKEISLSTIGGRGEKIFAKWFTGTIEYSSGEKICENIFYNYNKLDCDAIYEFNNVIVVSNGEIKRFTYDNRHTSCGRFSNKDEIKFDIYIKLNTYTKCLNDIAFSLSYTIGNDGHLNNIQLVGVTDSTLIAAIMNSLEKVDGLPVYYINGQLRDERFAGYYRIAKNIR